MLKWCMENNWSKTTTQFKLNARIYLYNENDPRCIVGSFFFLTVVFLCEGTLWPIFYLIKSNRGPSQMLKGLSWAVCWHQTDGQGHLPAPLPALWTVCIPVACCSAWPLSALRSPRACLISRILSSPEVSLLY